MKPMIFITLAFIAILTNSCSEDFTDPKALSGTTWRCSTISEESGLSEEYEYFELKFISTSTVEIWNKPINGNLFKSDVNSTYSISNKTITITMSGSSNTMTGIIDNKTMTIISLGYTYIFNKQ